MTFIVGIFYRSRRAADRVMTAKTDADRQALREGNAQRQAARRARAEGRIGAA